MRARAIILAGAALLALAACSNATGGPAGAYQRGLTALDAGRPRTARIELLNAIKAEPNNGAIRLAQARTYIALGDGIAAEAEINRARQLGVPVADTRHLMAHALLIQDKPDRALMEAVQAAPEHSIYAARMRGRASLQLGDLAAAGAAFDEAVAGGGDQAKVWTDIARFRRAGGELAGAVQAADRAVRLDASDVEALSLRGELTRGQYGLAAALPWFDRALQIDPDHVPTLLERAATLGDLGRMRAMLADTRKALTLSPGNPVAFYLQAMLAARARKFELAQSLYARTKGALDDKPAGMLLAGIIALETGNSALAIDRLGRLVALQPDNRKARRLLGAAQWRRGDAAGAIATLRPLADLPDADAYVLSLVGQALQKQGKGGAASVYLARAAQPQGGNALLGGPVDAVRLSAMRAAADRSPNDASLLIPLIRALLATGLGAEALDKSRQLQARNPGAPDAHLLVGDALGMHGDFAGAAREYRRAANIAFSESAAMRLIEALRRSGNGKGAAQVLDLFLQQNPQNMAAQTLAANSYLQAGQWDNAILLYERLRRRVGNRDATLLNNLAWAYSETGAYDRAIPLATAAWNLDRGNPSTADTLGWLLLKSGKDKARGLVLLEQAARGAPTDAEIRAHLEAARRG